MIMARQITSSFGRRDPLVCLIGYQLWFTATMLRASGYPSPAQTASKCSIVSVVEKNLMNFSPRTKKSSVAALGKTRQSFSENPSLFMIKYTTVSYLNKAHSFHQHIHIRTCSRMGTNKITAKVSCGNPWLIFISQVRGFFPTQRLISIPLALQYCSPAHPTQCLYGKKNTLLALARFI